MNLRNITGKKRIFGAALLALAVLYALDDLSARLELPSRPRFATLTISRYYYVNEKYNKFSYEPRPAIEQRCVNALMPHSGSLPCWYVKRHLVQITEVN